jgi:Fe-S cluster biogenesis protein NfuA
MEATMALHGAALERIVELAGGVGESGRLFVEELGRDELVGSVLVLYGLHPVDLETRVEDALEKARPYLRSHGGNVELIGIDQGETVRVRLDGSCHGCPASALTLRTAIESAVKDGAPEITSIVVVGEEAA